MQRSYDKGGGVRKALIKGIYERRADTAPLIIFMNYHAVKIARSEVVAVAKRLQHPQGLALRFGDRHVIIGAPHSVCLVRRHGGCVLLRIPATPIIISSRSLGLKSAEFSKISNSIFAP